MKIQKICEMTLIKITTEKIYDEKINKTIIRTIEDKWSDEVEASNLKEVKEYIKLKYGKYNTVDELYNQFNPISWYIKVWL